MHKLIFLFFILFHLSLSKETSFINIGLIKDKFTEYKINDTNLNMILLQMLSELNISPIITTGTWGEINSKFLNGDIDLIFPTEKNFLWDSSVKISENIYSQPIYIASNKINVKNIENLNNSNIHTLKNSNYTYYVKKVLSDNNINASIIEVDEINDIENIIVYPATHIQDMLYTNMIAKSPLTVIAYRGNDQNLIKNINYLLQKKYRDKIIEHKNLVKKEYRNLKFFNSLTSVEKNYLNNLKYLNIAYEENSIISHYLLDERRYSGLIPLILTNISDNLNIKLKIKNEPYEKWDKIIKKFDNKNIDILGFVKLEERQNKYIFSDKLMTINTYKIEPINYSSYGKYIRMGVIKNSVEEHIAKKYYTNEEVVTFNNSYDLSKALKDKKITAALHINRELVNSKKFRSEIFYTLPLNLAFHKDEEILRNIFNKAYKYIIDKDLLNEKIIESEKNFYTIKLTENESSKSTLYNIIVSFLIFSVLTLIKYLTKKRKKTKQLEKLAFIDALTGLGNRYSFNKACLALNSEKGVAIVIDLDNFKEANDSYGHSVGDDIIKYCGGFLKNIFGANSVFRISGDEYYIFTKNDHFQSQLDQLKRYIDKSDMLNKYSIYLSIGYFFKTRNIDTYESFKIADIAMYEAKCIKGNAIIEGLKNAP